MSSRQPSYSEDEWAESAGHKPLQSLQLEDLALLHRHWMWANQQREAFEQTLDDPSEGPRTSEAMLASRGFGFMFVWYAMLWAVIEACLAPDEGRTIDLRRPFRADVERLSPILRPFRNAVFHVPRTGEYVDPRLLELVSEPDSALAIRRVHEGFGRLFLEELRRRRGTASA